MSPSNIHRKGIPAQLAFRSPGQFDAGAQRRSSSDNDALCVADDDALKNKWILTGAFQCRTSAANGVDDSNHRASNRCDFRELAPSRREPGNIPYRVHTAPNIFLPQLQVEAARRNRFSNPTMVSPAFPNVSETGADFGPLPVNGKIFLSCVA